MLKPTAKTPVAIVLGVVALAATAPAAPAAPLPATPALVARGQDAIWSQGVAERGMVVLYGVKKFFVHRPATVLDFAPARLDPGLEVLAVRATFIGLAREHDTRVRVGGWPGTTCSGPWPHPGFGPTYPAAGLLIRPGDTVGFAVYVRPSPADQLGRFVAEGYRLRFRADGVEQVLERADGTVLDMTWTADRLEACREPELWAQPFPGVPGVEEAGRV